MKDVYNIIKFTDTGQDNCSSTSLFYDLIFYSSITSTLFCMLDYATWRIQLDQLKVRIISDATAAGLSN